MAKYGAVHRVSVINTYWMKSWEVGKKEEKYINDIVGIFFGRPFCRIIQNVFSSEISL